MDVFSDDSDVDIDEVAKMVENLDDLDNNLFGDTLSKNKNSLSTRRAQQNTRETQKKVVFEDNDENSLSDLLSDSNESHYNTKPLSNARGSKIADLFGTKTTEDTGITSNNIAIKSTESNSTYPPTSTLIYQKSTINVDDELNVPIKTGEIFKQPVKSKKSSLMEDLYGPKTRASSMKNISETVVAKNFPADESVSASMPNLLKNEQTSRPLTGASTGFMLSSSTMKEPRRGRPKSTLSDDPLGLLTASKPAQEITQKEIPENSNSALNPAPIDNLPEWLGGTKKLNQAPVKSANISATKPDLEAEHIESTPATQVIGNNAPEKDISLFPDVSRLAKTQFDQQSVIMAMQQQEHELRTATILAHQTDQLNTIAETQKNKMNEQERLFDNLVQHQINRQAMLETQIKMQQARIDNFIQTLMKQPMLLSSASHTENKDLGNNETENATVESACLLHTLEVEKNNFQHLLEIMKEKQKQEINILNDSHDMQMRFMQETMDKLEAKLRREIEGIEKNYENKIEKLLHEKEEQEKYFKEEIENLKSQQAQVIKEMHNQHSERMLLNQKEHAETIENITRAIDMERQAVDFIKLHKTELDSILERSQVIFDGFQSASDEIKKENTDIIEKREKYLKDREESIQEMIQQLNMQQKILDDERKQLVITAQKFESDTLKLTIQLEKNAQLFNEREERVGIQEKTLLRERELLQEQIKWEREHFQSLKETWMTDLKQQIKLLANEREVVAAERAKLEVMTSLKSNSDDITKVELEAAIEAAHNSTHQANLERQRWQERAAKLQEDQRKNEMKERQLMQKAKELEDLTQSALMKQAEGLKALKDAQRLEKQHKDQLCQLQQQLETLAERENKIATEKIALARERLSLRVSQIDKPEKDVTNDTLRNKIYDSILDTPSRVQTHFKDVVDPQLLFLKLNLDNRLDASNQLLTDLQTIS